MNEWDHRWKVAQGVVPAQIVVGRPSLPDRNAVPELCQTVYSFEGKVVMVSRFFLFVCICLCTCSTRSTLHSSKTGPLPPGITYSGGDGESFQNAIKISGTKNQNDGILAEYHYISKKYGERGTGWFLVGQTVIREENKIVDVIEIDLGNSKGRRIYYFDVTGFLY